MLSSPRPAAVLHAAERIDGIAHNTPVMMSRTAATRTDARLFFGCEDVQRVAASGSCGFPTQPCSGPPSAPVAAARTVMPGRIEALPPLPGLPYTTPAAPEVRPTPVRELAADRGRHAA